MGILVVQKSYPPKATPPDQEATTEGNSGRSDHNHGSHSHGHGGPTEIVIHNETGLLFEPNNHNSMSDALEKSLKDPKVISQLEAMGAMPMYQATADFREFLKKDAGRWDALIKRRNLKLDN
jgi:hypothetical protein